MGGKKNKQKKRAAANQAANQPGNVRPGTPSHPTQSRSEARLQVPFFPIRPERPVQFPLRNQQFMQSVPRLVFPHSPQRAQLPLIQFQRPYQQTLMVQRPQFVLQPRPQPPFGSHPSHNFTFLPNPFLYHQYYPECVRSDTQVTDQASRQEQAQRLLREYESQPALQSTPMAVRTVQEKLSRCNIREITNEGEELQVQSFEERLPAYLRHLLEGTGDLRELADISPDEFLKLLEYGCRVAEEIARKNRMRPCFKNIQSLCANTRCDILLPNNNISNIHTQGLSWITKDFIYAFIRLINTWNLLRQYVGFRPGSLGNVERALGCGFSRCFQQWEGSSRDLTYFLMRMFCLINNTVEAQMQYQRAWNEEQQETPPVSSAINYPTPQQSVDPQLANQQYVEQQYVDQFGLPIPQSLLGSMGTGDLLHTLSIFKNISDNESAHSKDNQNEPESEEPNRLDVPEENKDTDITVLKAYNQHKRTDSSSSSSSGMSYAGAVPEQDLVKKDESIPFRRHSDLSYNTFQPLPQDNSWMHMSQPSTSQYDATSSHYGELSQYDQNLTYGDSLHYVDPSPYIDPSLYGQSSGNDQTVPYVEESGSGNIPPYGDPVYFEELSRYMYNTFQSTPPPSVSVPPPQPSVHIPNEPGIQEILEQNLESFAPFELNTPQNPVVHFPQRTESRIVIPQARVPDQDLSNLAAAGQVARAFKPEKVFEIEGGGLTMAGYVTLEEVLDTFETDELNTLLAYTGSIDTVMVPASIKTIRKKVTSATYEYINEFVFDLMHALMNAYSYYSSLSLEPGAVAMVCYKVRFYEILMRKFPNYDFSHIESHSVSLGPLKRKEKKE